MKVSPERSCGHGESLSHCSDWHRAVHVVATLRKEIPFASSHPACDSCFCPDQSLDYLSCYGCSSDILAVEGQIDKKEEVK